MFLALSSALLTLYSSNAHTHTGTLKMQDNGVWLGENIGQDFYHNVSSKVLKVYIKNAYKIAYCSKTLDTHTVVLGE